MPRNMKILLTDFVGAKWGWRCIGVCVRACTCPSLAEITIIAHYKDQLCLLVMATVIRNTRMYYVNRRQTF